MKKTVLILSAGGPCGVACIKILRELKTLRIVAADKSKYAAGLQMADVSLVIPSPQDDAYLPVVEKIIEQYHVDVLMPSFESGIAKLSEVMTRFNLDGKSALLYRDKFALYTKCVETHLPVPYTEVLARGIEANQFPKYIKPRIGSSTIDHHIAKSKQHFVSLMSELCPDKEYLIQDILTGQQWTVDVFVENGQFITAATRKDVASSAGQCITAHVVAYDPLISFARKVQEKLNLRSPFNLEVFEVAPGKFTIIEINVRFGSGIIFSALAGVDMVSYLATKDRKYLGTLRESVYTRFYEEIRTDNNQLFRFGVD